MTTDSQTILLIEDDVTLMDMYRLRFEKEGYRFLTANRGSAGLQIAAAEKPDLILLDLVMPEMDGYQVLEQLKADPATKDITVFIFSNLGQEEEVKQGYDLGAEGYIVKSSMTPTGVVERVNDHFGRPNDHQPMAQHPHDAAAEEQAIGGRSLEGVQVLLMDDNEVILDMYSIRLEREGATVVTAQNGAWGLKQAREQDFDIILMDMVMPALDGLSAIKT